MKQQIVPFIVLGAFISLSSSQKAYQIRALNLHNEYRQEHHAPELEMDDELNSLAVRCAKYYARMREIDHSCPYIDEVGENSADGSGGDWSCKEFALVSTKMWYEEEQLYDYNNPGFSLETGHFTQLVWKSSQQFGFGCARVNGYTVGVGLYSPAGNYEGQFRKNVRRP